MSDALGVHVAAGVTPVAASGKQIRNPATRRTSAFIRGSGLSDSPTICGRLALTCVRMAS